MYQSLHVFDLPVVAMNRGSSQRLTGQQDDPGSPDMLLWRATRSDDRFKPSPVRSRDGDADTRAHAETSHGTANLGILDRTRL